MLAAGMVPSLADNAIAGPLSFDRDQFVVAKEDGQGIFAAGCAKGPFDVATSVQDATAAAAMAIETLHAASRG